MLQELSIKIPGMKISVSKIKVQVASVPPSIIAGLDPEPDVRFHEPVIAVVEETSEPRPLRVPLQQNTEL